MCYCELVEFLFSTYFFFSSFFFLLSINILARIQHVCRNKDHFLDLFNIIYF